MTDHLIDAELFAIMQCPSCAGTLTERVESSVLVCTDCGLQYPVRDGIPVMLIEEATPGGQ